MISELTGGDICYGQPVNITGLIISIIIGLFLWDIVKYAWRNR